MDTKAICERIIQFGGGTFEPRAYGLEDACGLNSGYGISLPSHEVIVTRRMIEMAVETEGLSRAMVANILRTLREFAAVREFATGSKSLYVGAWIDAETAKVHLDVTMVVADRDNAIEQGKAANQIAIWDFSVGGEIRLDA